MRGEQARPAHAGVVPQIEAFAIDRCPLADQSPRDAPIRRYELSRLDLTWVIEMSALDAYDRGLPLLAAWTDATGTRVALADLLRAQMRLYEINRQCGAPGFLPERGIHTVGMLLRVAGLLHRDASRGASSPRPRMQRALADDAADRGRRWLDESARALTILASPNAMIRTWPRTYSRSAGVGDAVDAPVLSAATRAALRQRLVTCLTAVAPEAPFSLATHALHAFGAASQPPATPAANYPCAWF